MPSQKDGIVSPAMAPTRMATSAAPPRVCAIRQPTGTASTAPTRSARKVSSSVGQRCRRISPRRVGRSKATCRNRRAAPPGPEQVLLDDRTVETDAAVEFRHALGRDLGVGPEHDRHRVAGDQPDHQEDDDRHAEQDDDEIDEA